MGVSDDAPWERSVIEAPTLHEHEGTFYLFYSGNSFDSVRYAVGYATADDLLGPYADAAENPVVTAKPPAGGPGHQGIVQDDDGDLWLTFHAWDIERVGYGVGGRRAMWIDELVFEDGKPAVLGPDAGPRPIP
jgi:beta-xylosidase